MTTSSTKPASSMAELMARHKDSVQPLKKGEEIKATVTTLKPDILLHTDTMDVQVLEKDRKLYKQLVTTLAVGQEVVATVLYPESDSGYPLVTLRHFMEKNMWEDLKKLQKMGKKLSVEVVEYTKGGLVVETSSGFSGFLPNSHMSGKSSDSLVGQKLQVSIAEVNRDNKKVVFSQKSALTPDDFAKLTTLYKAGTKIEGTISGITQFGMFVSLPFTTSSGEQTTVDGLTHISEVSWEKVEDLSSQYQVGERVNAVVIGIDPRSKRIDLSIKRLSRDPFQAVLDNFPVDKKVTGIAKEMTELGLVVDLGEVDGVSVEGLIKKDKIPPTTTYETGVKVSATVVSVDSKKRKVMLTPVLLEKPLMYR